jgi:transcription antitermination factor NusG
MQQHGLMAGAGKASMNFQGSGDNQALEQWFALRVKSRSEKLVALIARNKGFQEFLPLHQCRRRWSDRFKSVELPLFPGYVFCRLNPERRLPILTIPGVLHFVGLGRIPVPIDDAEIAAIEIAVRSGLQIEQWPFLNVGQRVRVEFGPLAGVEGILVEVRKQRRIVVSVSLLQRSVGVEIEARGRGQAYPGERRGPSAATAACTSGPGPKSFIGRQ